MDLNNWAVDLLKQVDSKWAKYPQLKHGYSVFYSPVKLNPDLMIIGVNPGGSNEDFNREKALLVPTEHEYITENYPIAKKTKGLFESIGKIKTLDNSIKLNLNFFRSKDMAEWKETDSQIRKELESFCRDKVMEIINTLKPRIIIAEGVGETYPKLKELLSNPQDEKEVKGINDRNIYMSCDSDQCKLIGIIHVSGARVSNDELNLIGKSLLDDL